MSSESAAEEVKPAAEGLEGDLTITNAANEADDDDDDGKKGGRRFFPRVKQLVNPEWEHFLQGVLHSVQAHQAHTVLRASGMEDNAWYQVFHAVYAGIAAENCSGRFPQADKFADSGAKKVSLEFKLMNKCCIPSVPQGKNRYHKFKDKIVELWRYMAVTEAPDHDVNSRLWKLGQSQWDTYKSLLVVAGKSPVEITVDATGSPNKMKKKGRGKIFSPISRGLPMMHFDLPPRKNHLPSPLHELHTVWKMSLKHNDPVEMGYIRGDYNDSIKVFTEDCLSGPDVTTKLLWHLEGLNELREVEQESESKKLIGDAYKQVLQRYLGALNKKNKVGKKATVVQSIVKI